MQVDFLDHVRLAMPRGGEDAARAFYTVGLGLPEVEKPHALRSRGGVWFGRPGVMLHLGVETPFAPALKAHPALRVTDLGGLVARLAAAGVTSAAAVPIPGWKRVYVSDPFGNRIKLMERRGPGNG